MRWRGWLLSCHWNLVQVVCEIVEIINLRPLESIDVTPQEREAAAESPTGLT